MILNADSRYNGGVGDLILGCWLSEASNLTSDRILFFTRDAKKRIILQLLDQPMSDDLKHAIDLSPAFERESKELAALPRWQYWVEHLKRTDLTPVCPPVTVSPFDAEWVDEHVTKRSLLQRLVSKERKLVLIFPNASQHIRMWPTGYWMDLSEMLYAAGYFPLVLYVGNDLDDLFRYSLKDAPLERIAAMMRICALTITPDSFPAHLAATVGCPTLTIWGASKPESVFGHCLDRIQIVRVSPEIVPCVGCNSARKHIRAACGIMCQALAMLQPKIVFEKCQEMLT